MRCLKQEVFWFYSAAFPSLCKEMCGPSGWLAWGHLNLSLLKETAAILSELHHLSRSFAQFSYFCFHVCALKFLALKSKKSKSKFTEHLELN